jgi:hypothetical protein
MAKIKYRCDDNGHEFDGNDFTNECPTCGSSVKAISTGSGIAIVAKAKEFVANNKKIVGAIALLILISVIYDKCGQDPKEQYSISRLVQPQNPLSPYVEVEITSYIEGVKKRVLDPNEVLKIIDDRVTLNSGNIVRIKDKNRIYLCPEYAGGVTYFTFKVRIGKKFKDSDNSDGKDELKKDANFSLGGITESPLADCPMQPLNQSEIKVESLNGCKLKVIVTRDLKGKELLVSVDGKDGDYQKKYFWDRKPLINTKQNVWVYIDGEDKSTAGAANGNGDMIPEGDCVPKNCSEIKTNFIDLANNFGLDATNRSAQKAFQAFLNNTFTKQIIYLNAQSVDLSELQQKMRISAKNNASKFRLQGVPELSDNCSTITFSLQEY